LPTSTVVFSDDRRRFYRNLSLFHVISFVFFSRKQHVLIKKLIYLRLEGAYRRCMSGTECDTIAFCLDRYTYMAT